MLQGKEIIKMAKFKVSFEIEGTRLADGCLLDKEGLEETIMVIFDEDSQIGTLSNPDLDCKVTKVNIEEI